MLEQIQTKLNEISEKHGDSWDNFQAKSNELTKALAEHNITITVTGSANLGRCYSSSSFQITSAIELTNDFVHYLRKQRLLGYGQEFYIRGNTKVNNKYIVNVESRVDSSD